MGGGVDHSHEPPSHGVGTVGLSSPTVGAPVLAGAAPPGVERRAPGPSGLGVAPEPREREPDGLARGAGGGGSTLSVEASREPPPVQGANSESPCQRKAHLLDQPGGARSGQGSEREDEGGGGGGLTAHPAARAVSGEAACHR